MLLTATVCLGVRGVEEIVRKVKDLAKLHPDLLQPKRLPATHTPLTTSDAAGEAEEKGVWALKAAVNATSRPSSKPFAGRPAARGALERARSLKGFYCGSIERQLLDTCSNGSPVNRYLI